MSKRTNVALGFIGILIAIQFFRPSRTNPPIDAKQEMAAILKVDPAVQTILNRSCQDCHTNRTVWPGYSEVAPISWLVIDDVNGGRRHMNFSEWGTYPDYKQKDLLDKICKEVSQHDMPLVSYTLVHGSARLSEPDRQAICNWTKGTGQSAAIAEAQGATGVILSGAKNLSDVFAHSPEELEP